MSKSALLNACEQAIKTRPIELAEAPLMARDPGQRGRRWASKGPRPSPLGPGFLPAGEILDIFCGAAF